MKNLSDLQIVKDIKCELAVELKSDAGFNAAILENKIKDAYRKVREKRCYQYSRYSQEEIEKDLYDNYYSSVKDLALYYFVKIGGEFQVSHSENGIARTWKSENDVLSGVISFVKLL